MSITKSKKDIRKFVLLEKKRDSLAKSMNYKKLFSLYKNKKVNLKNLNTGPFWDAKLHSSEINNPMYDKKIMIVTEFLCNKKGSLLDIGFGNGRIEKIINIKNKKIRLFGIEISIKALQNVKKMAKGTYKKGTIYKIPFKSSLFDTVLALDVLEHVPTHRTFEAYSEIYRVLKKNGVFIMSVPVNEQLDYLLKKGQNPNGHLRILTKELIKAELKISRFKLFKIKKLFAFHKNFFLKNMFVNLFTFKKPNLLIFFSKK